jgi:molecular chaperone HscA
MMKNPGDDKRKMQIFEIKEPEPSSEKKQEIAIGIDFGTTNSLVAYSRDHKPYIIDDELVPTILGDIKSIKRLVGKSFDEIIGPLKKHIIEKNGIIKIKIGNEYLTIPEAISRILKLLKAKAESHLNEDVHKAVITVPAHFDDTMRACIKQAASLIGLEVLRLISEPTAAAYAYGLENGSEGIYTVYDFGGGTFDVSLLRMQMGVFQVLATAGDTDLGGDDIDHIIFEYLAKQNPLCTLDIAIEAKKYLSKHELWEDTKFGLKLDKETFEKLIMPLLERSINITSSVIENTLPELKGIILVGGSTRIPLVKKLLANFKVPIYDNVDPDKVVALGAALQAENLTFGSRNLLIDVVPLSLGMELMGGIVEKIILRNTPIPIAITKEFTTYADNQTEVQLNIVQGEREMVEDCRMLGKFALKNIPLMKAGIPRVEVTFAIDADGLLNVTAVEKLTNTKQVVEIRPAYGISNQDVMKMVEESYIHAEEDHAIRLLTETIIDATKEIKDMKIALSDTPNLISAKETKNIEEKIAALEVAVKKKDRDNILSSIEALEDSATKFIEKRMDFILSSALKGEKIESIKNNVDDL